MRMPNKDRVTFNPQRETKKNVLRKSGLFEPVSNGLRMGQVLLIFYLLMIWF